MTCRLCRGTGEIATDDEAERVVTVRMPKREHEALRAASFQIQTSMNRAARAAIRQFVGNIADDETSDEDNPSHETGDDVGRIDNPSHETGDDVGRIDNPSHDHESLPAA